MTPERVLTDEDIGLLWDSGVMEWGPEVLGLRYHDMTRRIEALVLGRVRAEKTGGDSGTDRSEASRDTAHKQPDGQPAARQSSEPDVESVTKEAHEACPCRDPHVSIKNGCGFCVCTVGIEQGSECRWPGHAAIDRWPRGSTRRRRR